MKKCRAKGKRREIATHKRTKKKVGGISGKRIWGARGGVKGGNKVGEGKNGLRQEVNEKRGRPGWRGLSEGRGGKAE